MMRRARLAIRRSPGVAVIAFFSLVVSGACLAWFAVHARPATEAVRLRNALLFEAYAPEGDFSWTPGRIPDSYAVDEASRLPALRSVLARMNLRDAMTDWMRVKTIAEHLHEAKNRGGAAKEDLAETYEAIRDGRGYCSDFTTVFIALAAMEGIFSREWAFSFDGYGGYGHGFVEYFDRDMNRWVFLDIYNNFVVVGRDGYLMSALEVRRAMDSREGSYRLIPVSNHSIGFPSDAAARDYYLNGIGQWYLWWGNAVEEYDANWLLRLARKVGRTSEQLVAILTGYYPRIHILQTRDNRHFVDELVALKWKIVVFFLTGFVSGIVFLGSVSVMILRRRCGGEEKCHALT